MSRSALIKKTNLSAFDVSAVIHHGEWMYDKVEYQLLVKTLDTFKNDARELLEYNLANKED